MEVMVKSFCWEICGTPLRFNGARVFTSFKYWSCFISRSTQPMSVNVAGTNIVPAIKVIPFTKLKNMIESRNTSLKNIFSPNSIKISSLLRTWYMTSNCSDFIITFTVLKDFVKLNIV